MLNTNIFSWPGFLHHNRAKESLIRTGSCSYCEPRQTESKWIISNCPDWVKLVKIKNWTGITWAVSSSGCSCQTVSLQCVNLHGNITKKGCDCIPCMDKWFLMTFYQWIHLCPPIRDTGIIPAFSCHVWPFIILLSPLHKEDIMFSDGEVFFLW